MANLGAHLGLRIGQHEACVSLNTHDYLYPTNLSPEQVAREQQKLLRCHPRPLWGALNDVTSPVGSQLARSGAGIVPKATINDQSCSPTAQVDEFLQEPCMELDDLMHDLFGCEDSCAANAAGQSKLVGTADCLADRSHSDASTSTQHIEEEQDAVDLLFSNTGGSWREWMGLEWHHHGFADQQRGVEEATSPPGTFLKLNHEATAIAINCALHTPAV